MPQQTLLTDSSATIPALVTNDLVRKTYTLLVGFLRGFLLTGLIIAILAGIANFFLHRPVLQLTVAAAVVVIFSDYTLPDTSRLVRSGETNFIFITVALYLDVLNIFVALQQLLDALQGKRR